MNFFFVYQEIYYTVIDMDHHFISGIHGVITSRFFFVRVVLLPVVHLTTMIPCRSWFVITRSYADFGLNMRDRISDFDRNV
jgi:hypothetical protein